MTSTSARRRRATVAAGIARLLVLAASASAHAPTAQLGYAPEHPASATDAC